MELDYAKVVQEWSRAIKENEIAASANWAVYVSTTGNIQARPQDDKNWALFLKANAWGAKQPEDPQQLVLQSDIRTQLNTDFHDIIKF